MIKEVLELVKNNNRVIIPNFGAFIISKENGYSVLFNNFLSFNDGLLVNHIAQKEGVDAVEALKKVNDFVDSLKADLDNKGEFVIKGLGKFTKDANGIMRFHQDEDIAALFTQAGESDSKTEEKDLLDIDSTSKDIKIGDNKEEVKEVKAEIPKSLKKEKLLQIDQEEKVKNDEPAKKEEKKDEKPASLKEPVNVSKEPKSEKTDPREKQNITIQKQHIKTKTIHQPENDNKRRRSILLFGLLFILLPLLIVAIYFTFFRNKPEEDVEKKPVPVIAPVPRDTIPEEPSIVEEPEEINTETKFENRYQIIAGTFSSEKAANEYVLILKGKGFGDAFSFPRSGYFLVSIDSEKSFVAAEELQEKIVNNYKIENYILTVK